MDYMHETLIREIDNWRSLEANLFNRKLGIDVPDTSTYLEEIRNACNHNVYVHLSTKYVDDGLCDPDFYSSYRCLLCGSDAYDVPSHLGEYDTCCINMHLYNPAKYLSDEEKFAIAEFYVKGLVRRYPDYTIKQIIFLLNEELAKP